MRFRRESLFVGNIGFDAVARLREGVTMEQVSTDLARMLPMAWEKFPGGPVASSSKPEAYAAVVQPLKDDLVGSVADLLWVLMGGVAANVRDDGMGQDPILEVYWPQVTLAFWEGSPADQVQTWRTMGYAIRSNRVGTSGFLQEVRKAVWSVNPNLPLTGVRTLPDLMAQSTSQTSFAMVLLGIAAAVALILGIVGVYGVISYAVSLQAREIGLRMALGAKGGDVKRMVLRQGLILSGIGVAFGLVLAFGLTRLMAGLLFGVTPTDPITYAVMAAGLVAVALTASYLPARRAASVDPITVLRAE
jgi:hypothetical protein